MNSIQIYRFLDGEMTDDERSAFMQAVESDPVLSNELAQVRSIMSVARTSQQIPVPDKAQHAVLSALIDSTPVSPALGFFGRFSGPRLAVLSALLISVSFAGGWLAKGLLTTSTVVAVDTHHGDQFVMSSQHSSSSDRNGIGDASQHELDVDAAGSASMSQRSASNTAQRVVSARQRMDDGAQVSQLAAIDPNADTRESTQLRTVLFKNEPPVDVVLVNSTDREQRELLLAKGYELDEMPLRTFDTYSPYQVSPETNLSSSNSWAGLFVVGVRATFGSPGTIDQSPRISSSVESLPTFSANVAYKLSSDHYVGIGIGVEPMRLNYSYDNANGMYTVEQVSTARWISAFYRFEPTVSVLGQSAVQPYVELGVGGWQGGPLVRANVGLGFELTNGMVLAAGYEEARFVYSVGEAYHLQSRSGWTLGMRMNLGMLSL